MKERKNKKAYVSVKERIRRHKEEQEGEIKKQWSWLCVRQERSWGKTHATREAVTLLWVNFSV